MNLIWEYRLMLIIPYWKPDTESFYIEGSAVILGVTVEHTTLIGDRNEARNQRGKAIILESSMARKVQGILVA